MLLKGKEDAHLEIPRHQPRHEYCHSHRRAHEQELQKKIESQEKNNQTDKEELCLPLELKGKNEYLYCIGNQDAIKEEVRWQYGL